MAVDLDSRVLEFDQHWLAGVDLQTDETFFCCAFWVVVDDIDGLDAIDEVLQVIAAGEDRKSVV